MSEGPQWVNSFLPTMPSDTHMATEIWVNIGSGNGLLPDGTKPLPEPMLTNHQWSPVTLISGQFHRDASATNHLNLFQNYIADISFKFPRGQWVNLSSTAVIKLLLFCLGILRENNYVMLIMLTSWVRFVFSIWLYLVYVCLEYEWLVIVSNAWFCLYITNCPNLWYELEFECVISLSYTLNAINSKLHGSFYKSDWICTVI